MIFTEAEKKGGGGRLEVVNILCFAETSCNQSTFHLHNLSLFFLFAAKITTFPGQAYGLQVKRIVCICLLSYDRQAQLSWLAARPTCTSTARHPQQTVGLVVLFTSSSRTTIDFSDHGDLVTTSNMAASSALWSLSVHQSLICSFSLRSPPPPKSGL